MRRHLQMILLSATVMLSATFAGTAQVAAGGTYTLEQSVIAGGGGTSSNASGNQFSITGAIGQSVAGGVVSNSFYSLQSGFFTVAAPLAPTTATVIIGGRVMMTDGRGITNVLMSLTDSNGQSRTATTTTGGYYSFTDVEVGSTYIITATGKRFTFAQPSQVVNVSDDMTEINFVGTSEKKLRVF